MTLELTNAIGPDDNDIDITGTVPDFIKSGYLFALDDELLDISHFRRRTGSRDFHAPDRNRWTVRRELAGTARAEHEAGTAIRGVSDVFAAGDDATPPGPFATTPGTPPAATNVTVDPGLPGDPENAQEAMEGLAALNSGRLRLRKIVVNFDDFTLDEDRGIYTAPVYTLQEGDWVYLAQQVVTEAFDDSLGNGAQCAVYADVPGWGTAMSHPSNLSVPPDAPIALAHADQGHVRETYELDGNMVWPFTVYPGGAAVPLHLRVDDWANDGTQGSLYVALWVAEF